MKKLLGFAAGALLCSTALFGQVLPKSGVQNTLSTHFGLPPYENSKNYDEERNVHFYGFLETLQVRCDISKFTVEGMLNWGALCDTTNSTLTFTFENTKYTPLVYNRATGGDGGWWSNPYTDSYYVNFLFHPIEGLDLGMGTRLNWSVGPAPSSNGFYWAPTAHIVQGGLKDAAPGDADVVGFTYYANSYTSLYANNTRAALGARYRYKDFVEVGIAIPSGVTTEAPLFNAGLKIHPVDFLTIGVTYEGIIQKNGNLYAGLTMAFKPVTVDAYFAFNFREKLSVTLAPLPGLNIKYTNDWTKQHFGTGAALTFNIAKIGMTIRPEAAFTWYAYTNYTMATYFGARMDWAFAPDWVFGAWSSFAIGSRDTSWKDYKATEDWIGGTVFNVRPDLTWKLNKRHSLSTYLDFTNTVCHDRNSYVTWASGFYWTYKN